MLPPKPFSEMTEDEILAEIRSLRVKRVAAKERASKPRGTKKIEADNAFAEFIRKALADKD